MNFAGKEDMERQEVDYTRQPRDQRYPRTLKEQDGWLVERDFDLRIMSVGQKRSSSRVFCIFSGATHDSSLFTVLSTANSLLASYRDH
jgi:hypothetical protein